MSPGYVSYRSCSFTGTKGGRQQEGHVAGNAMKHGEFAANEVVVVQNVAAHAYVDQSLVR